MRWGEDGTSDAKRARQPVLRTPGTSHSGSGLASVKILFKPGRKGITLCWMMT